MWKKLASPALTVVLLLWRQIDSGLSTLEHAQFVSEHVPWLARMLEQGRQWFEAPDWIVTWAIPLVGLLLLLWLMWPAIKHRLLTAPPEHSTRIKFSSEQTITRASSPFVGGDTSLNLDNVATLRAFGKYNLSEITLHRLDAAPLLVDKPEKDAFYPMGSAAVSFPGVGIAGMDVRGVSVSAGYNVQVLDFSSASPTQIIEVGKRGFRVTLRTINDKSIPDLQWIEYVFAISEE